jgi:hypothetical protein
MFNLLTKEYRDRVKRMYRGRLAILTLLFVFIVGLILLIFLAPSLVIFNVREASIEAELQSHRALADASDEERLKGEIEKVRSLVGLLSEDEGAILPKVLFDQVRQSRKTGIDLTGLRHERDDGIITVSGISLDRETLLSFVRELEAQPLFTNVELPIATFVHSEDISFSITIEGKF